MIVERRHDTQPVEVLDRVLDKGIVIDAWLRVSLAGIDLLRVDARVVVASIETYLKYADAGPAGSDQALAAPAGRLAARDGVTTRRASQVPVAARIAQAAIDAWNGHDLHGYGALLNDDYVGETHALPVTLYGRGAARRAMRMKLALFPDLRFDLHDVVTTGDEALVSWVATATCGHERVRVSGCTVGRVRNGKIGHTWCYWDASPMLAPLRAASDGPHTLHCFTTTS